MKKEKKVTAGLVAVGIVLLMVNATFAKPMMKNSAQMRNAAQINSLAAELEDYQADVNNALADLKGQIKSAEERKSGATVGGVIFMRYQKYLSGGSTTNYNNFDIDRVYVDLKEKLDGGAALRVTTDVARQTTDQNLWEYLKYAYVELPVNGMKVKLGQQQTVWIDWMDHVLGLRYLAKSLTDNEGIMTSSDLGVGVSGKLALEGAPAIDYQVTALNGSGYKSPETNSAKNVALRVNSNLYSNADLGTIFLGLYTQLKDVDSSSSSAQTLFGGAVGLKGARGTIYAEYAGGDIAASGSGKGLQGLSLGGIYELMPKYRLFARVDSYDPNTTTANNELNRTFYGVTYDWSKNVKLAADVQSVTGASAASTSAGKTTSIFYLHSQVSF